LMPMIASYVLRFFHGLFAAPHRSPSGGRRLKKSHIVEERSSRDSDLTL
jgi:hypothetical protein